MQLTISLDDATARKVRSHLDRVQERRRQGDMTVVERAVFEAVEASLPIFFNPGDRVDTPDGSGWVVDTLSADGLMATCRQVVGDGWDVWPIGDLIAEVATEGLTG